MEKQSRNVENVSSDVRRSKRSNKGVPPERFAEKVASEDVASTSICVVNTGSAKKREEWQESRSADFQGKEYASVVIPMQKLSELINSEEMKIPATVDALSVKGSDLKSKKSSVSTLNFELRKLQKQREFEEEKLKILQKKQEIELQEIDLQMQLNLEQEYENEEQVSCFENKYEDPREVKEWMESSKKYEKDLSDNSSDSTKKQVRTASNKSFSMAGGEKYDDNKMLMEIARQCLRNTENTTKLCLKNKMKDLMYFSGEITEWPLFISEFKRTTNLYALNDYDNLIRLDRALRGRARDTVKALLTTPENVPRIIRMLEMNYGRSEWIILMLMDKVKKFPSVKDDKVESCIAFSNVLNNMVITMKNVNTELYLYNPEMLANVVDKLSPMQRYSWGKFKQERDLKGASTSLEDFSSWFEDEVGILAAASNPLHRFRSSTRKETVMTVNKPYSEKNKVCVYCKNEDHDIKKCEEFLEKSTPERREIVCDLRVCFLCLKVGHTAKRCFDKERCGTDGCKGKHSNLLHMERSSTQEEKQSNGIPDLCAASVTSNATLLRIAPVVLEGNGQRMTTFALFDEGSTCTMIEESLADKLNLYGPTVPLCFQWTNGIVNYEDDSRTVSIKISADTKKPQFYNMYNVRTVGKLDLPRQQLDVNFLLKRFPYLDEELLYKIKDVKPNILIGQDNCGLTVPRRIIQPKLDEVAMSHCKLGWTVHGPICTNTRDLHSVNHATLCCSHFCDKDLHLLVKNSFKLEEYGGKMEKVIKSREDQKAARIMEDTLRYKENRYEIGHLYKEENCTFPDSKHMAMKRLLCMERKMVKHEKFAKEYCKKIDEYVDKGYARKLETSEVSEGTKDWYLPHFAVWNENKPGKIRLVFDAAAKSFGKSLIDCLFQGPDFVPSIVAVLWRFRQGRIAFSGDIKEMFHQVLIRPQDRCSQRFLWREGNASRTPDVYQMDVMIFGAISSPSVAQFVKNKNAEKFVQEFPNILRHITKQHYVDDYLDSCNNETEAIERIRQIIYVHHEEGFEMTKWITNSEEVKKSIPQHLRAEETTMFIDTEKIERILGLSWLPVTDKFMFTLDFKKFPEDITKGLKCPTKREVLRIIMSIFDSLGFLAPIVIKARILMQEIWMKNIEWDNEITEELFLVWKQWTEELKTVSPIKVNRIGEIHENSEEEEMLVLEILPDVRRFSKWLKMIRTTACILHVKNILKLNKTDRPREIILEVKELKEATKLWILKCKKETIEKELYSLKMKKELKKCNRLYNLSRFIDKDNIIRLKGRFPDNLNLDADMKHPIILDPKHRVTELLIQYYHKLAQYVGVETVMNNLRLKFWILHIRSAVKKCFTRCHQCKIQKCKPIAPRNEWLMGKVIEVYPRKDGVVRVVNVSTKKGSYIRPVNKVCVLPNAGEDSMPSRGGEC